MIGTKGQERQNRAYFSKTIPTSGAHLDVGSVYFSVHMILPKTFDLSAVD